MVTLQITKLKWPRSHRLISSKFPPIDLFDDIAPPEDWEKLAQAESRSNPRIWDQIGNLGLVPIDKRVNSSWAMAAFTHVSKDRPSRFSNGEYGVYYCAKSIETAILETVYHQSRFLRATCEPAGTKLTMRELICAINQEFVDIRGGGYDHLLDKDDYSQSQTFSRDARREHNGIVYPSVRDMGGECLAVFWPNCLGEIKQARHWQYHWDGGRMDYVKTIPLEGENTQVYRLSE